MPPVPLPNPPHRLAAAMSSQRDLIYHVDGAQAFGVAFFVDWQCRARAIMGQQNQKRCMRGVSHLGEKRCRCHQPSAPQSQWYRSH